MAQRKGSQYKDRLSSTNDRTIPASNIDDYHGKDYVHETIFTSFTSSSTIFSSNPEKARAEQFFALWSLIWISIFFYIIYTKWFEWFTPYHYLSLGLLLFLVPTLFPVVFPSIFLCTHLPFTRRYTTKANLYIGILSWIGNYFWTHYFYTVLRATYTFEAHRLNNVPFALYLITQSYFHLYHLLASIAIRFVRRRTSMKGSSHYLWMGMTVLVVSYIIAFSDSFTVQHFPYYDIPDRYAMYLYGSMFYSLVHMVTFPMFARLDEDANTWNLWKTFTNAMTCCMIVTQLLDLWRLFIGPVTTTPAANPPNHSIPFIS
jgi:cycloeucalenol cycloisomerase